MQDPDPDQLARGMDPRIQIRIHPKMSWIRNTGFAHGKCVGVDSGVDLKVPSHQFKSAWKWYAWIGLHMYMNRRW